MPTRLHARLHLSTDEGRSSHLPRSVLSRAQAASLPRRRANPPELMLWQHTIERKGVSQGVRECPHDYAVVWRTGHGPTSSGRLALGADELVLQGSGEPEGFRISFDELSSVEIGRGAGDRINGEKSLVLERHSCERVLVAALGGVGLLGELTDLLARLRAEHVARACMLSLSRSGGVRPRRLGG
jgi:hypothetical protein